LQQERLALLELAAQRYQGRLLPGFYQAIACALSPEVAASLD